MISYIRGRLASVEEQKAIVEAGGIGYGIYMPNQALSMLPQPGNEVKIYTYFFALLIILRYTFSPTVSSSRGESP